MSPCTNLSTCAFFNRKMANMPFLTDILIERHCLADKEGCARFRVHSAGVPVPQDLFPDDLPRAADILADPIPAVPTTQNPSFPQIGGVPAE
jgi:hypothetical protein